MHYQYKDHSFSNTLTHSAVYRPASPSPQKSFKRPSSKYSQTDQANPFKLNGSFCSPQTTKKGYLRNTVDAHHSSLDSNTAAVQTNRKISKMTICKEWGKLRDRPLKQRAATSRQPQNVDPKIKRVRGKITLIKLHGPISKLSSLYSIKQLKKQMIQYSKYPKALWIPQQILY